MSRADYAGQTAPGNAAARTERLDRRIAELQSRLTNVNALLVEVLGISKWHDSDARANLKLAIRAVDAVRTDLTSVCEGHQASDLPVERKGDSIL